MKRALIVAVAAVCFTCCFLSGCGSSPSSGSASNESVFAGTWNAVEMTGDQSYSKEQLEALRTLGTLDVFLNLDEGGKAVLNSSSGGDNSVGEGTWTADSPTQVTVTFNGASSTLVLADGVLSMSSGNSTVRFEKVDRRDALVPTSASGDGEAKSAGSADASGDAQAQGSSSAESASSSGSASSGASQSTSKSAYEVSIDAAETGADYQGEPMIVVTFTWKNNSEKTTSYASSLHAKCFQNGVQLDTALSLNGVDSDGYMSDVRPGYGTTFQMAYKLKDSENPVEVEVGPLFSYKGEILASKTFEL